MGRTRGKEGQLSLRLIRTVLYILFVLGVSLILTSLLCSAADDMLALTKDSREISISIPKDASVSDISRIMKDSGIIRKSGLFSAFMRLKGVKKGDIKEGSYTLDCDNDYSALLSSLKRNSKDRQTVRITIPEGYTTAQIVELLVEKGVCGEDELWDVVKNYDFDYDFLEGLEKNERRLEGFLFPDTYDFYVGDTAINAISRFLKNFNSKFTDEMKSRAKELGYSVNQIVIIASLVEREAKLSEEQEKIAGVIYNRLNSTSYPYLQIDASVQYVLGHKETLNANDLKTDSPYNTYLNKGLTPGPIANPGLGAINAALNPEKHSYYFYVAKSDGSHIFSKTLEEHNKAKASVS